MKRLWFTLRGHLCELLFQASMAVAPAGYIASYDEAIDLQVEKVERLRAERDAAISLRSEAIGEKNAHYTALCGVTAEGDRLRAALKPFADSHAAFVADHVEAFSTETPDHVPLLIDNEEDGHHFICTVGDFRRAAEVLGVT